MIGPRRTPAQGCRLSPILIEYNFFSAYTCPRRSPMPIFNALLKEEIQKIALLSSCDSVSISHRLNMKILDKVDTRVIKGNNASGSLM